VDLVHEQDRAGQHPVIVPGLFITSLISLMLERTALTAKRALVREAMILARVVFPSPGAPRG
jgi:hypothetical protein